MSEKIIITTEEVEVSDLKGREKQIYDYAYKKGYNEAIDRNKEMWAMVITRCFLILLIAFLIFALFQIELR